MTRTLPKGLSEITRLFLDHLERAGNWHFIDLKGVDLPEGWKYLGHGVSRHAFLSPDGWVYKIGGSEENADEVNTSQLLYLESDSTVTFPYAEHVMDLKDDVVDLKCSVIELSVMRMEYIEGVLAKNAEALSFSNFGKLRRHINDLTYKLGKELHDLHGGNIVMRDNVPCVIDMAY